MVEKGIDDALNAGSHVVRVNGDDGVAIVAGIAASAELTEVDYEVLFRTPEDPTEYPIGSFPGDLEELCHDIRNSIKAPMAIVGQSLLGALALATQACADTVVDGRRIPISCFFVTVGKSGERKSAVDRIVLKPHRKKERWLVEEYEDLKELYKNELDLYERAKKKVIGKANGITQMEKARKQLLEEFGKPPIPLFFPNLIVEEPTYEGLIKLLAYGQPGVGLFSDEGGRMFGGFGMTKENILKTASGLSELWDGKPISRVRATDETLTVHHKRLSLHMMIQPVIARSVLSDPMLTFQGFLSRCLLCWPLSTIGYRPYEASDVYERRAYQLYSERIFEIFRDHVPEAKKHLSSPRTIRLSEPGKKRFIEFHDEIEKKLRPDGSLSEIVSFANKAPENALRVAAVLQIYDDPTTEAIDEFYVEAGINFIRFYLTESMRIRGMVSIDEELEQAAALFNWISQFEKVHPQQIYQNGPYAIRNKKTTLKLMGILESHHHVKRLPTNTKVDGKKRRLSWEVRKLPPCYSC